MQAPLSPETIEASLKTLPGWQFQDDQLKKTFLFNSFPEAMSFMVRVGFEAEQHNHHPEFFNVYNRVVIGLSTHDAGNKVTDKDLQLANTIETVNWLTPE